MPPAGEFAPGRQPPRPWARGSKLLHLGPVDLDELVHELEVLEGPDLGHARSRGPSPCSRRSPALARTGSEGVSAFAAVGLLRLPRRRPGFQGREDHWGDRPDHRGRDVPVRLNQDRRR